MTPFVPCTIRGWQLLRCISQEMNESMELDMSYNQDGIKFMERRISTAAENYRSQKAEEIRTIDSIAQRDVEHATTDGETLSHLLNGSLGIGILLMSFAFMHSGLVLGIFATIATGLICTHCSYVLVKSVHVLYYRAHRTAMNYGEICEMAFMVGPACCRHFAPLAKFFTNLGLFLSSFGICAVYAIIAAHNFEKLVGNYTSTDIPTTYLFMALCVALLLITWMLNFRYLALISIFANICMGISLAISFFYLVTKLPSLENRPLANFHSLPKFFAIAMFSMHNIGIIMPLQNNMSRPGNFLGLFGVLSQSKTIVTLTFLLIGFFGYWRYGTMTNEAIIYNLPFEKLPVHAAYILVALSMIASFSMELNIALEIVWNGIKGYFSDRSYIARHFLATALVASIVWIAAVKPTIVFYVYLVGAVCLPIIGVIFPVLIELLVDYETGYGQYWILWKNLCITICGLAILVSGYML